MFVTPLGNFTVDNTTFPECFLTNGAYIRPGIRSDRFSIGRGLEECLRSDFF